MKLRSTVQAILTVKKLEKSTGRKKGRFSGSLSKPKTFCSVLDHLDLDM